MNPGLSCLRKSTSNTYRITSGDTVRKNRLQVPTSLQHRLLLHGRPAWDLPLTRVTDSRPWLDRMYFLDLTGAKGAQGLTLKNSDIKGSVMGDA